MIIKLLTYDTETTGNNPRKCGIRQISGLITYVNLEQLTYEHKEEFNFNVRPNFENPDLQISEEALAVGPEIVSMDMLKSFTDLKIIQKHVATILKNYANPFDKKDKFFLNGFNNKSFDDILLRQWWEDAGDKYYGSLFWPNSVDTSVLATNHLMFQRPNMENFKQSTVAKELGIELDINKLHDAKYDNRICFEIYKIINKLSRHDGKTK